MDAARLVVRDVNGGTGVEVQLLGQGVAGVQVVSHQSSVVSES